MALILTVHCKYYHEPIYVNNPNSKPNPSQFSGRFQKHHSSFTWEERRRFRVVNCSGERAKDDEEASVGVKAALSVLRFYKREISPLLLNSCRYVPTCSEYSMIAYKKYGVAKGTLLTAWRLCRCNPLGGSGFDPPRWFDEATPPEQGITLIGNDMIHVTSSDMIRFVKWFERSSILKLGWVDAYADQQQKCSESREPSITNRMVIISVLVAYLLFRY